MRSFLLVTGFVGFVLLAVALGGDSGSMGGLAPADDGPPPPLPPGVTAVSFERLSAFVYGDTIPRQPGAGRIPETIRALDGQRVRLRGHLVASEQDPQGRVVRFALSRTSPDCCFGRMPRINEWVLVDSADVAVPIANQLAKVWVTGTLQVGEVIAEGGHVEAIYRMRADTVE